MENKELLQQVMSKAQAWLDGNYNEEFDNFEYSEEVNDGFFFYRLHENKIFSDDLWETPFEVLERVQEEQTPYFLEKWDKEKIKQIDELQVKRLDKLNWTKNSDLNQ